MQHKKPRHRRSLNSELKDYYALGRALAKEVKGESYTCDICLLNHHTAEHDIWLPKSDGKIVCGVICCKGES